jgi:hypothetical protein
MAEPDPFLITPPPGLLPPPKPAPDEVASVATGSETRRTGLPPIPVRAPAVPVVSAPAPAPEPEPAAGAAPGLAAAAAPPAAAVPTRAWRVRLADGAEHPVGAGGIVLGRNPAAPADRPDAIPVVVDDPGKSVSKTHALNVPEGDRLRVRDLRSTNGVAVTPVDGEATVVRGPEGVLAGDGAVVALGDYTLAVQGGPPA